MHRLPGTDVDKERLIERSVLRLNFKKGAGGVEELFAREAAQAFDGFVGVDDADWDIGLPGKLHDGDAVIGLLDRKFEQLYEFYRTAVTPSLRCILHPLLHIGQRPYLP